MRESKGWYRRHFTICSLCLACCDIAAQSSSHHLTYQINTNACSFPSSTSTRSSPITSTSASVTTLPFAIAIRHSSQRSHATSNIIHPISNPNLFLFMSKIYSESDTSWFKVYIYMKSFTTVGIILPLLTVSLAATLQIHVADATISHLLVDGLKSSARDSYHA